MIEGGCGLLARKPALALCGLSLVEHRIHMDTVLGHPGNGAVEPVGLQDVVSERHAACIVPKTAGSLERQHDAVPVSMRSNQPANWCFVARRLSLLERSALLCGVDVPDAERDDGGSRHPTTG